MHLLIENPVTSNNYVQLTSCDRSGSADPHLDLFEVSHCSLLIPPVLSQTIHRKLDVQASPLAQLYDLCSLGLGLITRCQRNDHI